MCESVPISVTHDDDMYDGYYWHTAVYRIGDTSYVQFHLLPSFYVEKNLVTKAVI